MEYLRKLDLGRLAAATDRHTQWLLHRDTGATTGTVKVIKTPPEVGSPKGTHTHEFDQIPAGKAHRNWNRGTVPAVHLGFDTPLH